MRGWLPGLSNQSADARVCLPSSAHLTPGLWRLLLNLADPHPNVRTRWVESLKKKERRWTGVMLSSVVLSEKSKGEGKGTGKEKGKWSCEGVKWRQSGLNCRTNWQVMLPVPIDQW